MTNLNQKILKNMIVPNVSKEEQTQIVHRVEQLFAFADQIEQRVKVAQSRVNHLTQSILAKAFRGELTAEWRAQNPHLISGEHSAEALLLRIQLGSADNTFLSPDVYNQLFTMHGTTMIFLGVMPLSAMFFNFMIPLQIGARDVVFPRLNSFSFWMFLVGAIILNVSFVFNAAPNAGWFGYANLTATQYSPGLNTDFWVIGLMALGVASLAAAVNFFVTIINMRAPGMRMLRMPMFVWMSFITQVLLLLAFPIITVALIFLMADRYFGANFFQPAAGGDRKSTRLNSSHTDIARMPSSA